VTTVREAVADDGARIGDAHAEAWRVGYTDLFPPADLDAAVDVRRRMWTGLVGDPAFGGTLLVAEEAGVVVGFVHFGPAASDARIGEIYGFYVHPDSWGTGTAQALMTEAVRRLAASFTSAVLWTHEGNGRARRFYTKAGWTETGNQREETLWDGPVFPAVEYQRLLGRA